MLARLPGASLTAGVHEDDGTTSGKATVDVTSYSCERVVTYWFEIHGRMFDDFQTALWMSLVEPVLKRRPVATFDRVFKVAAERVERKLAETVRLSTKQRHDAGCHASWQPSHPLVHNRIWHRALVALRPAWPCASEERQRLR
jgi:hypothetical protein